MSQSRSTTAGHHYHRFNAQYVLIFGVVQSEVVALELKDEVSQAVMRPVGAEGYDYTYVIMPMRV